MSWITKHRPRELGDFIGHAQLIEECSGWIDRPETLPNLIFQGPPGTGKTSLAGLLVRNVVPAVIDIPLFQNAAKLAKMKIHELVNWIKQLKIQRVSRKPSVILAVIDEVDLLPFTSQNLLASIMAGEPILPQNWGKGREVRFILITNHIDRIHPALRDVCRSYLFTLKKREMNNIIRQFFGIKFKDPMCELILRRTNFDLRRVSVLSDQNKLFGFESFCEYIDDTEKRELFGQILRGDSDLDMWWSRGYLVNDFLAILATQVSSTEMLYIERDVMKQAQTDGVLRSVLIRLKSSKINSGLINGNEQLINAPASP